MEDLSKSIATEDLSDKTIRSNHSDATVKVSHAKPITSSTNHQSPLPLQPPLNPATQPACPTKSFIEDETTTSTQTATLRSMVTNLARCFDILLQNDVPENLARSLVENAANVGEVLETIKEDNPQAQDLLRALAELKNEDQLPPVPEHKLSWLQVLLEFGVPQHLAVPFVRDIVGKAELADKLHEAMPHHADGLLKKVFPVCVIDKDRIDSPFYNHHSHPMHRNRGVVRFDMIVLVCW